jgi:hypothetical protein
VAMIEFVNPQAIVKNVTNTGKDSEIYVVIAWLKRNNDSQANKMFPYPSFSYNYESNNYIKMKSKPFMQIISVESISCPALIIPNQKKGFFWDKRSLQPKTVLQNVTFYQVPYERAFRRYCNGFVEYTDSYSSQDQYKSGSNNYIPTNVIMCENDLVIVDNMIKTIDDQLQYPEENDTDSFNSIVNEDINYDSNEDYIIGEIKDHVNVTPRVFNVDNIIGIPINFFDFNDVFVYLILHKRSQIINNVFMTIFISRTNSLTIPCMNIGSHRHQISHYSQLTILTSPMKSSII